MTDEIPQDGVSDSADDTGKTPVSRRATQRHKGSPLNEQDWVEAALQILTSENVRGIKIDTLSAKLGVTKGSFYWHFKSRSELLAAMLSFWRKKMTLNIIRSISIAGMDPRARLQSLFALPRRKNSPIFAEIEGAIRDWGRRVEVPRQAVAEVDEIRFDYITKLFRDMGHPPAEARRRAYLTYCLIMGDSVLHRTIGIVPAEDFPDLAMRLVTEFEGGPRGGAEAGQSTKD